MRPLKTFIFDVEGTLIDCAAQMIDCWEHTFTKAGHQISRSEVQRYSGMDGDEMLRSLLPRLSTTMFPAAFTRKQLFVRTLRLPCPRIVQSCRFEVAAVPDRG